MKPVKDFFRGLVTPYTILLVAVLSLGVVLQTGDPFSVMGWLFGFALVIGFGADSEPEKEPLRELIGLPCYRD